MPAGPPTIPEPTDPYPPRYWWLKRLSWMACLLVLATAGGRWWWGHVAERRLAEIINDARARGEPILVSDYRSAPPPPDETNAAFYLRRAGGNGFRFSGADEWALDNIQGLPMPEAIADIAARLVKDNAKQLADVRDARVQWHGKIDWAIGIRSPMWNILLRDLNGQRDLSQLARAAALLAAGRGDRAAALEYARDAYFIGRAAGHQPFLVSQWFSTAAQGQALSVITEIVGADGEIDEAARGTLRALIAELLDEREQDRLTRDAIHGDRAMHVDMGQVIARRYPLLRPAIQFDTLRLLEHDADMLKAASAPDWPSAKPKLPTTAPVSNRAERAVRIVSGEYKPDLVTPLLRSRRLSAHKRLAAAALAIRLYQHENSGQRPPTLEALVPSYLPAVPRDPFAAGGQPIRYHLGDERPYLYSVGEDGVDDTAGGWRPPAAELEPLEAKDAFVDLARLRVQRPLPPRPATAPDE